MVPGQQLLAQVAGLLEQGQGLLVVPHVPVERGQVVQASGVLTIILPKDPAPDIGNLLGQRQARLESPCLVKTLLLVVKSVCVPKPLAIPRR